MGGRRRKQERVFFAKPLLSWTVFNFIRPIAPLHPRAEAEQPAIAGHEIIIIRILVTVRLAIVCPLPSATPLHALSFTLAICPSTVSLIRPGKARPVTVL